MTRLSIILLSYNTRIYLSKALQSIEAQKQKDWEVIVVDNASSDGSAEMVKKEFPWASVIKNRENLGFAAGNNVGIKHTQGQYIMLMNSDAELRNNASLTTLLDYCDAHHDVAVITPKVVMSDGSLDQASHRGIPTPWNALTYYAGLEKLFHALPILNRVTGGYHQLWKAINTIHEIDACTGAAMIIRASAIDEVGFLDEQFFMYGEDLDWCYRFKKAGWKVVFYPHVEVLHHKNKSGIRKEIDHPEAHHIKKRSHAHFFDTMVLFYDKHYLSAYPKMIQKFVHGGIRAIQKLKGA